MTRKDAGAPPHGRSGDPAAADAIERVVLIDGCSGVQYGRGNEQYSAYLVKLPSVALKSGEALARHLLSDDWQWSRAVFDHSGQASFAGMAGPGSAFTGATETIAGDTLVIVRNSRGVQVGDGNTQRNKFQVRVTNVAIKTVRVGPAVVSRAAVDHLCQQPSQTAARVVARQIADAAKDHLILDMTAQVTQEIGSPVIAGQPAVISGRTGVQAGGSARAHVNVEVEVTNVNVDRLAEDLLKQARRDLRAMQLAAAMQAVALSRPARGTGRARVSTADLPAAEPPRTDRTRPVPGKDTGPARSPGISPFGF
jgi:hypothetical protein